MKPEIIATSLRQHQAVPMNYCALNESEMGALASHDTGSILVPESWGIQC